jgi:hypothetical protein
LILFNIDITNNMAEQETKMDESSGSRDDTATRLAGDPNNGAPTSPRAADYFADPSPPTAAQLAEAAVQEALTLKLQTLLANLQSFSAIGGSETLDETAYEAMRALYPDKLEPLSQLLATGAAVRAQLLALDAERTGIFQLREAQAQQIKSITAERDALVRAVTVQPTSNPLQTPFTFGTLGMRTGMSLGTDGATSAATSSVYIQGEAPAHLVAPITSRTARAFRAYVISEKRAQRHVRYDALISNPARRLISLRFRLLAGAGPRPGRQSPNRCRWSILIQ